jgi:membrane-bound metal-dependent hydrolase YbcI (DUF457 family)
MAVAAIAGPARSGREHRSFGQRALLLVILAYLPDIFEQLGSIAGYRAAPEAGHSLLFAVVIAVVLAPALIRPFGWSVGRAVWLVGGSVALHDLMDLAQSPGRAPLWPLSISLGSPEWIPPTLSGEVLTCLPVLVVALAYHALKRRVGLPQRGDWPFLAAVALIVMVAAVTSGLRDRRESALVTARALAETGRYEDALRECDLASRWPTTAAPGRVDYVRALAWWGLGRVELAESLYLQSYRADPTYIWTAGDLALLYASSSAPLDERQRNAAKWLETLRTGFKDDPALPGLIERVQRELDERSVP